MGTRAIISFTEKGEAHHIYKHFDGYPSGVIECFKALFERGLCWNLPRYEADEMAAGFVAAAKDGQGNVRLARSRTQASDVEFGYKVYQDKTGLLRMRVTSCDFWDGGRKESLIWSGSMVVFLTLGATLD